jgi:hypothetical protein
MPVVYQIAAQHWAHAEQIRWTLLYNYLMASTILLLAWATVFASSSNPSRFVLVVLALAGVILSSVWIALGARATSFVKMYEGVGLRAESAMQPSGGPFASARDHRLSLAGIARFAPSGFVLRLVPSMFVALYVTLGLVSFCR